MECKTIDSFDPNEERRRDFYCFNKYNNIEVLNLYYEKNFYKKRSGEYEKHGNHICVSHEYG